MPDPKQWFQLFELKFEKKNHDSAKIIMNCNASPCDTLGRLHSTMQHLSRKQY